MAAFIILIVVCLTCTVTRWIWRTDWRTIEEENKRYYNEDGHHVYYDRKLIAKLEEERQKVTDEK